MLAKIAISIAAAIIWLLIICCMIVASDEDDWLEEPFEEREDENDNA